MVGAAIARNQNVCNAGTSSRFLNIIQAFYFKTSAMFYCPDCKGRDTHAGALTLHVDVDQMELLDGGRGNCQTRLACFTTALLNPRASIFGSIRIHSVFYLFLYIYCRIINFEVQTKSLFKELRLQPKNFRSCSELPELYRFCRAPIYRNSQREIDFFLYYTSILCLF